MKKRRIFGLLALTTLAAVSLASCDDNTVEPEKTSDVTENKASEAKEEYTIKFVDYDDKLISSNKYHKNDVVSVPDDPVRDGYYFNGWDSEVSNVNGDKTYKATYSKKESANITNLSTISKTYDGNPISKPTFDVDSDGDVKIEYIRLEDTFKLDEELYYTEELPSDLGSYYVRITVEETKTKAKTVYKESFEISSQDYIICNLTTGDNLELIMDKCGYVLCATPLDDISQFILERENYKGLTQDEAIEKHIDDLVNYELVDVNSLTHIIFEYSYNDYLNPLKAKIKEYLDNKYNQTTYFDSDDYSLSELKTTFRNYVYDYSSYVVEDFTINDLLEKLIQMRFETEEFKSIEAKRIYALYKAIAIYKVKIDAIKDSVKDSQMSEYSGLKNSLPSIFNSCTGTIEQQIDDYYEGYFGPCTYTQSDNNKHAMAILGLYDSIINNDGTDSIHRYIVQTVTSGPAFGARTGLFSAFAMLTGGYNSFLSSYYNYTPQIESLCETNGLDLDTVVTNNLSTIVTESKAFAKKYDYDLFDGYLEIKGDKEYYYQNQYTNETYYLTQTETGTMLCYIYNGLIAENELDNNKPIRYCTWYFNGNELLIEDYYKQDKIRLAIGDDNSLSLNNLIDVDIQYIFNTDQYGSGTVAFVIENNNYYAYTYHGKYTKEELDAKIAQYNSKLTWELINGHVFLYGDNDYVTNFVVDYDVYLKYYMMDIENVELIYVGNDVEGTQTVNYALVKDDGINYVLHVTYTDGNTGKAIAVDYDTVLEVLLDWSSHHASILWMTGDKLWTQKGNIVYFTTINGNKAYLAYDDGHMVDVTDFKRNITEVASIKKDFGDGEKYYYLVKITNYFDETRYEVRVYDEEVNDVASLVESAGFEENNYTWIETDGCLALIKIKDLNKDYKEYTVGEVLSVRVPHDDKYEGYNIDIDKDVNKPYSYYDKDIDQTFILFKFRGLNLAFVYNGEITGDFKTYIPEKLVTWDYISEDSINIDGVYEGKKFAEIVIDENDNLYKVEVDYY